MNRSTVLPGGLPANHNPEAQGLVAGPAQVQLQQALQQQAAKAGAIAPATRSQALVGAADAVRAEDAQANQLLQQHKALVLGLAQGNLPGYKGVLAMGANSPEGIAAAIGL